MSRQLLFPIGIITILIMLLLAGCGVKASTITSEIPPATSTPEQATTEPATATPTLEPPTATPTLEPTPAATEEEPVTDSLQVGDPERGREIFENGGEKYTDVKTGHKLNNYICLHCHSLDGSEGRGPSLQGISERAADRVPGLSAAEYIRQSILEPDAYIVEGTKYQMGRFPGKLLSEEEIEDLIAFLLTQ